MTDSLNVRHLTYIHQHFKPPTENGGGRPYEFARRLSDRGITVTMISAGSRRRTYTLDGFTVEEIPSKYDNRMGPGRRILSFLYFMARATCTSLKYPADVFLASSTPLTVVVPGIIAAKLRKARLIVEIRDLWPSVPLELGILPRWLAGPARMLERLAYSEADEIIALSPSMVEGVRTVNPAASVHLIPNASDRQLRSHLSSNATRTQLAIPKGTRLFVYAGSLGEGYDPDWLAHLALQLLDHSAKLIVVGSGKGLESASKILADSGHNPVETFIGPKSRNEALQILGMADVAVSSLMDHPALEGNSLNKVFDAYAAGVPIIFNHDGWLAELTIKNGAGWRWPRDIQTANMTELLQTLMENHPAASAASAEIAQTQFDRETLFHAFYDVVSKSPEVPK